MNAEQREAIVVDRIIRDIAAREKIEVRETQYDVDEAGRLSITLIAGRACKVASVSFTVSPQD